jgi:hypothetical protein
MKKLLLIFTLLLISAGIKAQNKNTAPLTDTTIYSAVDTPPTPPGGVRKFNTDFIMANLKPTGEKGFVAIVFVVEKDGSLTNIVIARHLSESADKEAIRVMSLSPKWEPGKMNGNPVRSKYTVPINFH